MNDFMNDFINNLNDLNDLNNISKNSTKETSYLGWFSDERSFLNKQSHKQDECNKHSNLEWQNCDKNPSCHHHKCITCPTGPTGPAGPGFNSYLNGVITTDKSPVAVGAIIIYDTVNIVGHDYSYDQQTGIFTVNTTGVYVFDWKLSVTPEPGTVSIKIDMLKFPSSTFVGGVSITSTNPVLNGSNIVYAATAGDNFGFVNNSIGPISIVLVDLLGPIGTISVHRID